MGKLKLLTFSMIFVLVMISISPRMMTAEAAAPPNDDFYSATVITSLPFSVTVDTTEATTGPNDPSPCGYYPYNSVWFSFTPASDTTISIDAFGTHYSPVLGIYSGDYNTGLSLVACNYGITLSNVFLNAGTKFSIMVVATEGSYPYPAPVQGGILQFNINQVWQLTGSMNAGRESHTATLLSDGQVLVTGGYAGVSFLSSAEIYNPGTGNWNLTGSMTTSRIKHTATLLSDGSVLVAGGYGNNDLASAEIYNPASGAWTLTGPMITARQEHTATLLPDGRVLVAGGYSNFNYLSSAEIYDPATGNWSSTGSMNDPRQDHSATLLPDGRVLVVGGFGNVGYLAKGEIFDPASGTWNPIAPMICAHERITATLLRNGRILVTGLSSGCMEWFDSEIYNPTTNTWNTPGFMNESRRAHTASLLPDGRVLVVAGFGGNFSPLDSSEIYDPVSGSWSYSYPMNIARGHHTATVLLDGRILSAGGSNSMNSLASAELYNPLPSPEPLVWEYKANIPHAMYQMGIATGANNNIYLFGGNDWTCTPFDILQIYHPYANTWSEGAPMPTGRWGSRAVLVPDGNLYVIGGRGVGCGTQSLATVEMYRPSANTWETRSPMISVRDQPGVATANGRIYVFGGAIGVDDNEPLATVEVYDPILDTWTARANMPYPDYGTQAVSAPNGKIYLFFSLGKPGRVLEYDPLLDTYVEKAPMPTPRDIFGAGLGSDGLIYVIGGIETVSGDFSSAAVEAYDPLTNTWSIETDLLTASRLVGVAGSGYSIFAIGGFGTQSTGSEGPLNLVQAAMLTTPPEPPLADFTWSPIDPSKYDAIQFCDSSADPASMDFSNFGWDFGDGVVIETDSTCVEHTYASDGDYQVMHAVQTRDGRGAEITKTVAVRTHDVLISRVVVPSKVRVGQTKPITVSVRNPGYPETVTVELYKSTPWGYVRVGTQTKAVPVWSDNRVTDFTFNYKFTLWDIGKMTFKAVATIQGFRDAQPANNTAVSLLVVVTK